MSGKRGFGAFPLALEMAGKGSFLSKKPHFPCAPLWKKGDFLTESSLFLDEGNGVLSPETLFSRKWGGFGALSEVGGIPTPARKDYMQCTLIFVSRINLPKCYISFT